MDEATPLQGKRHDTECNCTACVEWFARPQPTGRCKLRSGCNKPVDDHKCDQYGDYVCGSA